MRKLWVIVALAATVSACGGSDGGGGECSPCDVSALDACRAAEVAAGNAVCADWYCSECQVPEVTSCSAPLECAPFVGGQWACGTVSSVCD